MDNAGILGTVAAWLPAALIALSGVMKLRGSAAVIESMTKLGVGRYIRLLGLMEIAFAVLFVIPVTMKIGFILSSCYFAGAIATELSHDALKANPFIPLILLWVGAFIRNPSIFY